MRWILEFKFEFEMAQLIPICVHSHTLQVLIPTSGGEIQTQ